jgi:1-acyl-sn-glycerol-3-phosphate acyltransferase
MTDTAPGRVSPALVALVDRYLRPAVQAAFRPTLTGVENLPAAGPFLLVANHSAGLGLAELASFACLYLEHVGAERPLAGFAHTISFRFGPIGDLFRQMGAVPSTYEAAEEALRAGVPLLVFPGGDHETMRPVWEAARVDLGGRRGFLKIAKKFGVPIVPLGIRGSHVTAPILWRSKVLPYLLVLPRALGLKRWPLTALGLAGAAAIAAAPWSRLTRAGLAWAWLVSPTMMFPWVPSTLSMHIGAPLQPAELFADDDPTLERALARVQSVLQRIVDAR